MLTPSEVELLRQDLKSALKVLGQDEIDDAHDLFRRSGFRSTDFEILQRSDPSVPHVIPLRGTAVVIRKSNRIAKTYVAGHLSSWLVQLESDLKLGTFGRPEAAGPDHSLHTAPPPGSSVGTRGNQECESIRRDGRCCAAGRKIDED